MAAPEVSHGRGGAGNINPDDTQYVDGEVVRVGVEGSHGDGAFSTGRGGEAARSTFPCAIQEPWSRWGPYRERGWLDVTAPPYLASQAANHTVRQDPPHYISSPATSEKKNSALTTPRLRKHRRPKDLGSQTRRRSPRSRGRLRRPRIGRAAGFPYRPRRRGQRVRVRRGAHGGEQGGLRGRGC